MTNPAQTNNNACLNEFLKNSNEFRVHTGNIIAWNDLKLRTFANRSEELVECLHLQLEKWKPDCNTFQQQGNDFQIYDSSECEPQQQSISRYARNDLKITLKVFLSASSIESVAKCMTEAKKELQIDYVDQLIIALPPLNPDLTIQPSKSQQLLDLWPQLEELVESGHCATLGTADLNVDDLRRVYDGAKTVKPVVNHYNVAACFSVPPKLSDYAKQRNIALLTHNDPHPFLTTQQVQEIFAEKLKVPLDIAKHWEAKWAGKATAIVKMESVIASKGYVVHFHYIMLLDIIFVRFRLKMCSLAYYSKVYSHFRVVFIYHCV